jgi:DNA-binding MarR family transcriptional regulator
MLLETFCVDKELSINAKAKCEGCEWRSGGVALAGMKRPKSAEEILAHPRFAEARRAHIQSFAGFFTGNRFLIRLLSDSASLMLAALLVGFHAAYDEEKRATWATLGRLQELLAERGVASRRRLNDLIARFRHIGYIEQVASASDRRIRILKPTKLLVAHDRTYEAALHLPLHVLYPDRGYEAVIREDAHLHLAIRRAGFYSLLTATAFMARNPVVMTFLSRDAGYLALLLVAWAILSKADSKELSYTAIAGHLGVSRTHIRKLFVEAATGGYVNISGGRVLEIRPPLWEAFDRFLADLEAGRDAIAQKAFASLKESRGGSKPSYPRL